ncbi:acyl-CoA dehydrogenase family protein [Kitasatospora sp. NPDC058218]|uniref:acyl-CoA dehydrogenase family protein n=1 Tax=Kitasatospora sp. NPDC058218 TaxID=3346385 RepID=UPI0036DEE5EC
MTSELINRVRRFAETELLSKENWFDSRPETPVPASSTLHAAGLANWWLPAEYGTAGASLTESVDVVSALSYADAGFAFSSFLSVLGTTMLRLFAEPVLATEHLSRMARGGGFCGILASEEEAGSELGRITTSYATVGGDLVLNGDKYFSTNTDAADFLLVLARSAEDESNFGMVLLPRDTPGIEIAKRWDMIGMRGSATYQVRLTDCTVPAANLLRGNGLRNLEAGLNASRILIASTAIGIARRVRDISMEYAAGKQVKGAALSSNAVFAGKLGQIEMHIDVMRNQCRSAAAEFDAVMASNDPAGTFYRTGTIRSALAAKMFCGQAGWAVATTGSEMFGGLGYTHDHLIGKLVRDLRYVGLVEGGDDVIRDLLYTRYVIPMARRL